MGEGDAWRPGERGRWGARRGQPLESRFLGTEPLGAGQEGVGGSCPGMGTGRGWGRYRTPHTLPFPRCRGLQPPWDAAPALPLTPAVCAAAGAQVLRVLVRAGAAGGSLLPRQRHRQPAALRHLHPLRAHRAVRHAAGLTPPPATCSPGPPQPRTTGHWGDRANQPLPPWDRGGGVPVVGTVPLLLSPTHGSGRSQNRPVPFLLHQLLTWFLGHMVTDRKIKKINLSVNISLYVQEGASCLLMFPGHLPPPSV